MQVQMLWVLIQQDEFKSFFANMWGNTFAWETIVASTRCSEICGRLLLWRKHLTHLIAFLQIWENCTVQTAQKLSNCLEKNCRSYKMYWKLRFICVIVVFWRNLDLYAHILCNVCANTPGQSWKHFQYEVWGRRRLRLGGDDLDTVSGLLKAPVSRTKTAVVVTVWFDHYYYNKPQSFIRLLNPPHLTQNPSYW